MGYRPKEIVEEIVLGGDSKVIESLSDLPTPVGGVITLEDSHVYFIRGQIDLGSNRLKVGVDVTIRGRSPKLDFFTSTTTGALITSSNSFRIFECGFQANNGTIFDLNGTSSEICLMFGVRFFGTGGLGSVDSYDLFEITTALFADYTSGLTFSGANGTCILIDVTCIDVNTGVTSIDFGSSTFNYIKISSCDFTIGTNGVGLDIAPSGANINTGGAGIINSSSFSLGTGSVSTVGYSSLDLQWAVGSVNVGILPSDRIEPAGWGVYADNAAVSQVFNGTPTLLEINGLGSLTNEDHLPLVIRGTGSLWDTTNSFIKPLTIGDSYNLRIQATITATTSNPTRIEAALDIGGGATPTIVIATDSQTLRGGNPQPVLFSFPIFTLGTFIANGGQIFITVNSGTATISNRSILIVRTSSGAN